MILFSNDLSKIKITLLILFLMIFSPLIND
jgi:hypothetical protein